MTRSHRNGTVYARQRVLGLSGKVSALRYGIRSAKAFVVIGYADCAEFGRFCGLPEWHCMVIRRSRSKRRNAASAVFLHSFSVYGKAGYRNDYRWLSIVQRVSRMISFLLYSL